MTESIPSMPELVPISTPTPNPTNKNMSDELTVKKKNGGPKKRRNKSSSRASSSYNSANNIDEQDQFIIDQNTLSQKRTLRSADAETVLNEYRHLVSKEHAGPFFGFVSYLYGERKMFIVIMIHLVATVVIWSHFFLIKFQELEGKVPAGAPYYWSKRIIPPLEFGSMHAILFQMALLPLTMSRYTISCLSGSWLDKFFPLNKMVRMHIHIGYCVVSIIFTATILFFTFFGTLCNNSQPEFCAKFKSEIMQTGYILFFLMTLIGITAFLRHSKFLSYETFYLFHSLVIAMYILAIIHTFDIVQRSGERQRSQNVKWFSATLLYYLSDYAMLYINQRFTTEVKSFIAMKGRGGSRMGMLKLRRPTLFTFQPGQYAFLRAPEVDRHWHPFSIASDPNSNDVEFYIEICGKGSWTRCLWDALVKKQSEDHFTMEILGPYGTGIVNNEENVVAIGSGTGIVPILSVLKHTINKFLMLNPEEHIKAQHEREIRIMKIIHAKEARNRSLFMQLVSSIQRCKNERTGGESMRDLRHKVDQKAIRVKEALHRLSIGHGHDNATVGTSTTCSSHTKEVKKAIFSATRSIYTRVLIALLVIYGTLIIGVFISWCTIGIKHYYGMNMAMLLMVVFYQAIFAILAVFIWKGRYFISYIDFVISITSPFIDWYMVREFQNNNGLTAAQITVETIFLVYMTMRFWWRCISSHGITAGVVGTSSLPVLDNLKVVWVTRSAKLVTRIIPDIAKQFDSLVEKWGEENAMRVCQISIFVTDPNPRAVKRLGEKLSNSSLKDHVFFNRPDFENILEYHTLEMIQNHEYSKSLLTFCGSTTLSTQVEKAKIKTDMLVKMAGYKHHVMDFKSECHGGAPKSRRVVFEGNDDNASVASAVMSVDESQIIVQRKSHPAYRSRTPSPTSLPKKPFSDTTTRVLLGKGDAREEQDPLPPV